MTNALSAEREALLKQCANALEALLRAKRLGALGGTAIVALRDLKEARQRLQEWDAGKAQ